MNEVATPLRVVCDNVRTHVGDSGLWALVGVARFLGAHADAGALRHQLSLGDRKSNSADLIHAAALIGLNARLLENQSPSCLPQIPRPAILRMRGDGYAILGRQQADSDEIFLPDHAHPSLRTHIELSRDWTGEIILVGRPEADRGTATKEAYGLHWFFPAIWRHRSTVAHVLIASLVLQLFGLVMPIFTQVIIDKVLVHHSHSTLLIVTIGMLVIGLFDVVLQYLRQYAMSHTAARVDVELSKRVFSHLLKLPLAYFESQPAGQIVARMREIDTIRNFLTGQGLLAVLDILFAFVFVAVLLLYSSSLTLVVVIFIPVYAGIVALFRPLLGKSLQRRFADGAASQEFLVESIVGAQTLKTAAIDPFLEGRWDERRATFAKTSFQTNMLTQFALGLIQYASKLVTGLILFLGARSVMAGEMTIGELMAFNMIAGQVIAPVLRLAQLWQEFQNVKLAVQRVGDIVETEPETRGASLSNLPPLRGAISLRNVTFRYDDRTADVLKDVSLEIPAGQVVGIVGPSGSGKSTLTRLIQRLYLPQQGILTIDGHDIRHLDTAWLRRQIGVVLQDNLLFHTTIHQNIALGAPHLSREQVALAARLAGADEFICQLPRGYDSMVEERGANLSGGQRQRIALARALVHDPRILILDEATSAVDYATEHIIQSNLRDIVNGRTVIIIAHRLVTVRNCDRIVGIDAGRLVEDGTHKELLSAENGLYCRLWRLQSAYSDG